jgi:hypothetical protein
VTGAEHKRAAERFLASAENADAMTTQASIALLLQFAQVHATLALAPSNDLQRPPGGAS